MLVGGLHAPGSGLAIGSTPSIGLADGRTPGNRLAITGESLWRTFLVRPSFIILTISTSPFWPPFKCPPFLKRQAIPPLKKGKGKGIAPAKQLQSETALFPIKMEILLKVMTEMPLASGKAAYVVERGNYLMLLLLQLSPLLVPCHHFDLKIIADAPQYTQ